MGAVLKNLNLEDNPVFQEIFKEIKKADNLAVEKSHKHR